MDDEFRRMWKKASVAYVRKLYQNLIFKGLKKTKKTLSHNTQYMCLESLLVFAAYKRKCQSLNRKMNKMLCFITVGSNNDMIL